MDEENLDDDIDGCIQRIHVKNFFCHENLEVNFNRNVNFIVGRNGSGKSAILTALVVGLGGRASATNRGSNLHSFVKKGQASATVEIKIKNSSSRAYKHNLYGDHITIIRQINASGGSHYKLKSSSGEVISTKFEEVSSIILAHDIQVDNPISVLNQDDARSFHASDSKKKYSLFRKATNLDQTETNYKLALDNCKKATSIWNKKSDACDELEKEYKKWKRSHEQLQSRDEIEKLKQKLQNEYYWSEIAEFEKEAETIQIKYDKQKAEMAELLEKLKDMDKNFGSNTDVIQALKDKLKEKADVKTGAEAELSRLQGECRELKAAWRAERAAADKQKDALDREKRKVAGLDREIKNIESGSAVDQHAELESLAARARAAAEAAAARYGTAQHEAEQARAHLARLQAGADQAAARVHQHRNNIQQLKQQLRELESRGDESLGVYGPHMVELHARLQRSPGLFSKPPRGPVGSYIKVKEKKWGGAVEHILGGSVQTFCVNTPEDSRKLFEIMGQVYGNRGKPAVTCCRFLPRRHDVSANMVRFQQYQSALDSIHVSDPVVANFLIDNLSLESILLVPEQEVAMRLSSEEALVPRRCARMVTLDGSEYYPAPNYRSYGGAGRACRLLQVSTAERKRQVQAEIQQAESTLQELEASAAQMNAEAGEARDSERAVSQALQALLAERHKKTKAASAAATELDQHEAPPHNVLVVEFKLSKERIKTLEEQVEAFIKKEETFNKSIDDYSSLMNSVKKQLDEATVACRNLNEEIGQEQMKQDRALTERRTWDQRAQEDKIKLTKLETILKQKLDEIKSKEQEALTLCPRIQNPRDKMVVTNKLKKTQLRLSAIRSDGLSKAEVAERLLAVERRYRRTNVTLERLKLLIDDIMATTDKHLIFCHRVQTYIATRVQHSFQSILNLRGYSGRMEIDHVAGALEILCTGREPSAKRRAASTSSLSGGERSYSTVAFIMALWECVELPFYFMDEFDVFMDNVNRKVVMDLLIHHALKNSTRQFVFLTPQDASAVTAQQMISIHVMADPRP